MVKQRKISVSFKSNDKEEELYQWLLSKDDFVSVSSLIKQMLFEKMQEEKRSK